MKNILNTSLSTYSALEHLFIHSAADGYADDEDKTNEDPDWMRGDYERSEDASNGDNSPESEPDSGIRRTIHDNMPNHIKYLNKYDNMDEDRITISVT